MSVRDVGRNEPCPCDSGKKYKRCHGAATTLPAGPEQRLTIARRLMRALESEERRGAMHEAFDAFMRLLDDLDGDEIAKLGEGETNSAITTFALYDLVHDDGACFAQRFAQRNAAVLSADDLDYIDTMVKSYVDFYEVREVELHRGMTLRHLRTGRDVFVFERSATESLGRFDILATRVVGFEEGRKEIFPPTFVFDQRNGREALAIVRRALKKSRAALGGSARIEVREVLKLALPSIHRLWVETMVFSPAPQFCTTEGEPIAPERIRYRIRDRARILAILDAHEAFEREDAGDEGEPGYAFLGPEGSGHAGVGRLLWGSLRVDGNELVAEVMANTRGLRLRSALEGAGGAALDFLATEAIAMGTNRRDLAREEPPSVEADQTLLENADVRHALDDIMERHQRAWLDEPIPALSGKTPREAARSRESRPQVVALLKDIEARQHRTGRAKGSTFDTAWLWKELDLAP